MCLSTCLLVWCRLKCQIMTGQQAIRCAAPSGKCSSLALFRWCHQWVNQKNYSFPSRTSTVVTFQGKVWGFSKHRTVRGRVCSPGVGAQYLPERGGENFGSFPAAELDPKWYILPGSRFSTYGTLGEVLPRLNKTHIACVPYVTRKT